MDYSDEQTYKYIKKTGHVSPTESQYQYIYYKYYPIEDGYINIDAGSHHIKFEVNQTITQGGKRTSYT